MPGVPVAGAKNPTDAALILHPKQKFDHAAFAPDVFQEGLTVVHGGDAVQVEPMGFEAGAGGFEKTFEMAYRPLTVVMNVVSLRGHNNFPVGAGDRLRDNLFRAFVVGCRMDEIHAEVEASQQRVDGLVPGKEA